MSCHLALVQAAPSSWTTFLMPLSMPHLHPAFKTDLCVSSLPHHHTLESTSCLSLPLTQLKKHAGSVWGSYVGDLTSTRLWEIPGKNPATQWAFYSCMQDTLINASPSQLQFLKGAWAYSNSQIPFLACLSPLQHHQTLSFSQKLA